MNRGLPTSRTAIGAKPRTGASQPAALPFSSCASKWPTGSTTILPADLEKRLSPPQRSLICINSRRRSDLSGHSLKEGLGLLEGLNLVRGVFLSQVEVLDQEVAVGLRGRKRIILRGQVVGVVLQRLFGLVLLHLLVGLHCGLVQDFGVVGIDREVHLLHDLLVGRLLRVL